MKLSLNFASKLLILLSMFAMLSFVTLDAVAQTPAPTPYTPAIADLPDTAKVTLSTVYKDVKEGLKGLGAALKVGSEQVFAVLVAQQKVKSITNIVLFIFSIIGFWIFYKSFKKGAEKEWDFDGTVGYAIQMVVSGIFGCGLMIYSLVCLDETITGLINPEYGAIKDIFEFIRGGRTI